MARIQLTGKYAVGESAFTIVADDMLAYLSQWRWKAKPNGKRNNVYAVRNSYIDGRCVTVRMHRVVAGMGRDDPLEVDHDNHNSLDNRRFNLIRSTRSQNALNARRVDLIKQCIRCGVVVSINTSACASGNRFACTDCKRIKLTKPIRKSAVFFVACKQCQSLITSRRSGREFCNDTCRCRFRAAVGYVPPSRRAPPEPAALRLDRADVPAQIERVLETSSL